MHMDFTDNAIVQVALLCTYSHVPSSATARCIISPFCRNRHGHTILLTSIARLQFIEMPLSLRAASCCCYLILESLLLSAWDS